MKDTTPEVEALYHKMLMEKSAEERMMMGFSMCAFARQIVLSSIGDRPDWREQLFLRYYKDDFTPEQREKILADLRRYRDRGS